MEILVRFDVEQFTERYVTCESLCYVTDRIPNGVMVFGNDYPIDDDWINWNANLCVPVNTCKNCGRPCVGDMCWPNLFRDGHDICFDEYQGYSRGNTARFRMSDEHEKYRDLRLRDDNSHKRENLNEGAEYHPYLQQTEDGRLLPIECFYSKAVKKENLPNRPCLGPHRFEGCNWTTLPRDLWSFSVF